MKNMLLLWADENSLREKKSDKAEDNVFLNERSGVCLVEQVINKAWLLIFETLLTLRTVFHTWKYFSTWSIKVEVKPFTPHYDKEHCKYLHWFQLG